MALRQKDLFDRVKAMGLSIKKTEAGDYRVTYVYPDSLPMGHGRIARIHAKQEALAYYSDDRDDVYATAISMSKPGVMTRALAELRAAG